jgi:CheY-like chemotaxis protein
MIEYVLVVIDDVEKRELLYDILTQLNYSVTTTPPSVELVEVLKRERPDYIIMDMEASDVEREVTLKEVREVDSNVKMVILISGVLNGEKEKRLRSDDKIILLRKDVGTPQLIQSILTTLKRGKSERRVDSTVTFKGKVLIVDDEQKVARLISTHLNRLGYDTDIALSGEEAILKVRANKFKVVILDILMPGMDGLLVLKRIKEIDDSIVVIVTSGVLKDEELIEKTIKSGAATYLLKPFNLEQLEAYILASLLKESRGDIL